MPGLRGWQGNGRSAMTHSQRYRGRSACSQVCVVFLLVMLIHPHHVKSDLDCNEMETALPENRRYLTLPETTEAGYSFFNVTLTPPYKMTFDTENHPGYFTVNERTDGVTNNTIYNFQLKKDLDLESMAPNINSISVRVVCNPTGWKSTMTVHISSVNEFAPVFIGSPYHVNVSELAPIGTTVMNLENSVRDPDNTMNPVQFKYAISGSDTFGMDGTAVVILKTLDYDFGQKTYTMTITATEFTTEAKSNSTTLTISVVNEDDLNPKFTQELYNITLNEGTYSSALFNSNPPIQAVDLDFNNSSGIQYSLTGHNNLFTLLPNGSLEISGTVGLIPPVYSLSIKAFQTNRQAERYDTATLFITVSDINDHTPIMSQTSYTASVAENSPVDIIVLEVSASDQDTGGNAVFQFHLNNAGNVFYVQTVGTKGWVRLNESLDRERRDSYTFQIYVKETLTMNKTESPHSNVNIVVTDVNDNKPIFQNASYSFQIHKNASIGKIVGTVLAIDADAGENGTVTYKIEGTQSNLFSINETSGIITVQHNLTDDFIGSNYFYVIAQDQAPKSYIRRTVVPVVVNILDVNSGPPVFVDFTHHVNISENLSKHVPLLQLSAKDPDVRANSHLTYTITGGNSEGTFAINNRSGLITVETMLDKEKRSGYNIIVTVSDGELNTSTVIEVQVTDVNDNAPQFTESTYTFNITEEQTALVVVGRVNATDDDQGTNSVITYQAVGGSVPFDVNATSGVITTKVKLDRETKMSYSFFVKAIDGGQPALSSVSKIDVNVEDINDNPPVFNPPVVKLKYNEGTALSFKAQATDDDSGKNKVVQYYKKAGDPMFEVSQDGIVSSNIPLDRGRFNVTVVAYNVEPYVSNCNCMNATLTLIIDISDINNNPPVFNTKLYNKTIPEGRHTDKTPIITVSATDNDTDSTIVYKIISGNENNTFYLNPMTGGLFFRREIDYDPPVNDRIFNLTVQASDPANKSMHDVALVVIYITDVNDNNPVFNKENYNCQVSESAQRNALFDCQVHATDIDSKENGSITYTIQQQTTFTVDSVNGKLKLSETLDYESGKDYSVNITAADNGSPSRNRTCTVSIQVINENNNWPYFVDEPYNFTILQNIKPGGLVGVVKAQDADGDKLVFSLKNYTEYFQISNMGVLRTSKSLKCTQHYEIWLQVNDSVYINDTVITITSVRVNLDSPAFTVDTDHRLSENATDGDIVLHLSSEDTDCGEGGHVSYSIVGGNSDNAFKISNNDIVVACTHCLDYDKQKQYELLVKAQDGGNPTRLNFTVLNITMTDVNDKAPEFDRRVYSGSVFENAHDGTSILKVNANDQDTPDDELVYSLVTDMPGFNLSSRGVLTKNGVLDADTTHFIITGNVSVYDGKNSNFSEINITILDINDNVPRLQLSSSNISVPENAEIGNIIFNVLAKDDDRTNNGFTYWLTKTDGKFEINASNGSISVANYFDRSVQDTYNITIHVSDHGIPPKFNKTFLMVNIEDSNNAPVFWNAPYTFNVSENANLNTVIGEIFANDSDRGTSGTVRYEISNGNEDKMFVVDASSGNISVINNLDFEGRNGPKYIFTVLAKDLSFVAKTATASVTVNVENVPEAPQWPLPLPVVLLQTSRSCNPSRITAFSRDFTNVFNSDGGVLYSLLNLKNIFSIDNRTGILRANGSLEARTTYQLHLQACNSNYTNLCSEANLTVDVTNDNSVFLFCPSFIRRSVSENVTIGYLVVDMNTTSGDSGINYTITSGNDNQTFSINSSQGVITTAKNLDREIVNRYTLLVKGESENQTAEAQVIIEVVDVKDSPPRFETTHYRGKVSEAANISDPVLVDIDQRQLNLIVVAKDPDLDTQLTYRINASSDTSNGLFTIEASSGAITVNKMIDREHISANMHDKYTFQVTASDEKNTATATVTVRILDVNDNHPRFETNVVNISISEVTVKGTVIYQAKATDADDVDKGKLLYTMSQNDVFAINSQSGNITVKLALNRESTSSYKLDVVARDLANHTGKMELQIVITDENDNAPQFNQTQYDFNVLEGATSVNQSMVVEAHDADIGNNSVITFQIVEGNNAEIFHIETSGNEGILTILQQLDREDKRWTIENGCAIILLTVQATDEGSPPLKNTSGVTVHIFDINDNAPQFNSKEEYNSTVSEDANIGTSIHVIPQIAATDPDNGINGTDGIRYSLLTLNTPFSMNSKSGVVSINSTGLDREEIPLYILQIGAQDAEGSGNRDNATLFIHVTDINDAAPIFPVPRYTFNVSEDAEPKTDVGQVMAYDNDVNGNKSLRYTLISGDDFRFFIDRITGMLKVAGGLDREDKSTYNLNVSAYDGKYTSFVPVVISIEDVNDNCPSFKPSEVRCQVDENQQALTLATLTATDPDLGSSGNVSYFINNTDIEEWFSISSNGELMTTKEIDREKNESFFFQIYASDHGQPPCVSSTDVTVTVKDRNDKDPIFCVKDVCNNSAINVSILDKSPVHSVVALANAKDADAGENGVIIYSLHGELSEYFNIDENSGLVTVLKSVKNILTPGLSSRNSTVVLTIVATDKGDVPRNSSISLNIRIETVVDDVPEFEKSVYTFTIKENSNTGSYIGVVTAHLLNGTSGKLTYSIVDNRDILQVFAIQGTDGNISTRVTLDREKQVSYSFIVQVRDGRTVERTAYAVVTVNVSDENDNTPKFVQETYNIDIEENNKTSILLNVTATDADSGENGRITYSILNNAYENVFAIDKNTGILKLNGTLDREEKSNYALTIQATDNGVSPNSVSTTVYINVLDRNDEYPQFQNLPYVIFIKENENAISSIMNVSATDKDAGLNGQVIYRLIGSGYNYFQINAIDGSISSLGPLDYEHQKEYHLQVMAHDLGSPPLNSTTDVLVFVNNTYDTKPKFTKLLYISEVAVGTPANTSLSVSVDAGSGDFYYNITQGNVNNLFKINPKTAVLSLAKEPVKTGQHLFTINAYDKVTPQSSSSTEVLITVVEPKVTFTQEIYEAQIKENTEPPVMIADLNSSAEKEGLNVLYRLIDGPRDKFLVNGSTGQLYCIKKLDRENTAQYTLRVKVSLIVSASTRRRRSVRNDVAEVVVNVDDVNDNDPEFSHPRTYIKNTAIFGIPKSAESNFLLATLLVTDRDEGSNSDVVFNLTDHTDLFAIYNPSGQIVSLQPMSKASTDTISLKATTTDNNGKGRSSDINIKVVVLPDTRRFGLTVGISPPNFNKNKQLLIAKLSDVMGLDVQLEQSRPNFTHSSQNLDRTDLYLHAFDQQTGKALSYDDIVKKTKNKVEAIDKIFHSHALFRIYSPTSPDPITVTIAPRNAYTISKAEIAILVIAGFMFIGTIIAIVAVLRIWKKHEAYLLKQNLAQKARNRQTNIKIEQDGGTDEGFNETNIDSDNTEAIDLDVNVEADDDSRDFNPNLLLRPTEMSEKLTMLLNPTADMEDQEKVFVFGNEAPDFETIALRKFVARREMLDAVLMENDGSQDSGIEYNQEVTQEDSKTHHATEEVQGQGLVKETEHSCTADVQNQSSDNSSITGQNSNQSSVMTTESTSCDNSHLNDQNSNKSSVMTTESTSCDNSRITDQNSNAKSSVMTPESTSCDNSHLNDQNSNDESYVMPPDPTPDYSKVVRFSVVDKDDISESETPRSELNLSSQHDSGAVQTDIAVNQIAYPSDTPHIDVMTRF